MEQECIHIRKCPYTLVKFKQILSTSDPDEKNRLIKTMTHNVATCGALSDRTVCCDIDKGKKVFAIYWGKKQYFVNLKQKHFCSKERLRQ